MRRATTRAIPPPLELLCLNALWSLGQGSVKDVRQLVTGSRRGVVTRRKTGRAFVYAPAVSRDAMRRLALQEFLDSYFESSQRQLVEFLQGESRTVAAAPAALTANGLDPALL
jgi:predicted transcriptional regulator